MNHGRQHRPHFDLSLFEGRIVDLIVCEGKQGTRTGKIVDVPDSDSPFIVIDRDNWPEQLAIGMVVHKMKLVIRNGRNPFLLAVKTSTSTYSDPDKLKSIEGQKAEIARLNQAIKNKKSQIESNQTILNQHSKRGLEEKKKEISKLETRKKKLEQENETLITARSNGKLEQMAEKRAKAADRRRKQTAAQKEQQELKRIRAEKAQAEMELKKMISQLTQARADLKKVQSKLTEFSRRLNNIQSRREELEELEAQIADAKEVSARCEQQRQLTKRMADTEQEARDRLETVNRTLAISGGEPVTVG